MSRSLEINGCCSHKRRLSARQGNSKLCCNKNSSPHNSKSKLGVRNLRALQSSSKASDLLTNDILCKVLSINKPQRDLNLNEIINEVCKCIIENQQTIQNDKFIDALESVIFRLSVTQRGQIFDALSSHLTNNHFVHNFKTNPKSYSWIRIFKTIMVHSKGVADSLLRVCTPAIPYMMMTKEGARIIETSYYLSTNTELKNEIKKLLLSLNTINSPDTSQGGNQTRAFLFECITREAYLSGKLLHTVLLEYTNQANDGLLHTLRNNIFMNIQSFIKSEDGLEIVKKCLHSAPLEDKFELLDLLQGKILDVCTDEVKHKFLIEFLAQPEITLNRKVRLLLDEMARLSTYLIQSSFGIHLLLRIFENASVQTSKDTLEVTQYFATQLVNEILLHPNDFIVSDSDSLKLVNEILKTLNDTSRTLATDRIADYLISSLLRECSTHDNTTFENYYLTVKKLCELERSNYENGTPTTIEQQISKTLPLKIIEMVLRHYYGILIIKEFLETENKTGQNILKYKMSRLYEQTRDELVKFELHKLLI